ncbi:hypothetical protein BDAP_002378, partial [Binucleata daphniae]
KNYCFFTFTNDINSVLEEYKDIFKTEINQYTICKIGNHKIITNVKTIVREYNGIIPIALNEKINQ